MLVFSPFDTARAHEELPAQDPERMKGQANLAGHPSRSRRSSPRGLGVGPWTLGLGYETSDSANTRPHFGTTRWTRKSCLNSATATSLSLVYSSGTENACS